MAKLIKAYKDNYTIVDNDIFKDKRLSYKDLGLLCQLLSLPDNWNFNIAGIASLHTDGEDSIKSGLKKLEEYGYLTRKQARNESGTFSGYDYLIYQNPLDNDDFKQSLENQITDNSPLGENPLAVNPLAVNPSAVKPSTDKPTADNQSLLSNVSNKVNNNKNVVVYNSEDELSDVINDDDVFVNGLLEEVDKETFIFKKKMDFECYKMFPNIKVDVIKAMKSYSIQIFRYLLCTYPNKMDEVKEAQISIFKALSAKQFNGKENIINDFNEKEYCELLNTAFSINCSLEDIHIHKTPVAYLTGVISNMIAQHTNNQGDVKNE